MGRFGNVLLIGGETDLVLNAKVDEVVRLYLTNTANTRVFNVSLPGARMSSSAGTAAATSARLVDAVVLAPSERVAVDVLFEEPGDVTLEHRTPAKTYTLATIDVDAEAATPSLADRFDVLRHNAEWVTEREALRPYVDASPDKTLAFVAEMDLGTAEGAIRMSARCIPRWSATRPSTARSAAWLVPAAVVAQASAITNRRARRAPRRSRPPSARGSPAHDGRRDRVGRRHGRREPDDDAGEHALEPRRPRDRSRQPRSTGSSASATRSSSVWSELDSDHPMHHPFQHPRRGPLRRARA